MGCGIVVLLEVGCVRHTTVISVCYSLIRVGRYLLFFGVSFDAEALELTFLVVDLAFFVCTDVEALGYLVWC